MTGRGCYCQMRPKINVLAIRIYLLPSKCSQSILFLTDK
uniref:Uncharacterized protein n=1 Tax=Anguilla anguilla TaxID=7936 RepID=A0A0E9STY7_ANGAN